MINWSENLKFDADLKNQRNLINYLTYRENKYMSIKCIIKIPAGHINKVFRENYNCNSEIWSKKSELYNMHYTMDFR